MSRHCTDEELTGLVVGDLGRRRARQLAAHAADCAECSTALASTRALWSAAGELRFEEASDVLRDRTRASLGDVPARRRPWRLALGATGAAGLAAVGMVAWLTLMPSRQTIAFADVQKAMSQVRTVRWVEHVEIDVKVPKALTDHFSREVWVRADPPARLSRTVPDRLGPVASPSVQLIDSRGYRAYFEDRNEFLINRYLPSNGSAKQWIDNEMRWVALGPTGERGTPGMRPPSGMHVAPWRSATTGSADRPVIRFDRAIDYDTTVQARGGAPATRTQFRIEDTVWVDPVTRRISKWQSRMIGYGKVGSQVTVFDGFQYNQVPPGGTFVLEPPPGARVTTIGPSGQPSVSLQPK